MAICSSHALKPPKSDAFFVKTILRITLLQKLTNTGALFSLKINDKSVPLLVKL